MRIREPSGYKRVTWDTKAQLFHTFFTRKWMAVHECFFSHKSGKSAVIKVMTSEWLAINAQWHTHDYLWRHLGVFITNSDSRWKKDRRFTSCFRFLTSITINEENNGEPSIKKIYDKPDIQIWVHIFVVPYYTDLATIHTR